MSGPLSAERLEEIRARDDFWRDNEDPTTVCNDCYWCNGEVRVIFCDRHENDDDVRALLDYISYLEAQNAFQAETIRGMAVNEAR